MPVEAHGPAHGRMSARASCAGSLGRPFTARTRPGPSLRRIRPSACGVVQKGEGTCRWRGRDLLAERTCVVASNQLADPFHGVTAIHRHRHQPEPCAHLPAWGGGAALRKPVAHYLSCHHWHLGSHRLGRTDHFHGTARSDEGALVRMPACTLLYLVLSRCHTPSLRADRASQPRSLYAPESQRPREAPRRLPRLLWHMIRTPNLEYLRNSGLDAFFFLRYLHALLRVIILLVALTMAVIVPMNALGAVGTPGNSQTSLLDRLSWSNTEFYWAHLGVSLIAIGVVCTTIYRKSEFYVRVRSLYLNLLQQNPTEAMTSVLVTDIPPEMRNPKALTNVYGGFPGGVKGVRMNHNLTSVARRLEKMDDYVDAIEVAYTKKLRQMQNLKCPDGEKSSRGLGGPVEGRTCSLIPFRPHVTNIDRTLDHIAKLSRDVHDAQAKFKDKPVLPSAIIYFNKPLGASMACQTLMHTDPFSMEPHLTSNPDAVSWEQLARTWWSRYFRASVAIIIYGFLLVFWSIPVALTGSLSQIDSFAANVPWLHWVTTMPVWLLSLLQGVLPQVVLTILTHLFPKLLRFIFKRAGYWTRAGLERRLQKLYFTFLFTHNFLAVCLATSLTSIAQGAAGGGLGIGDLTSLITTNLPKSSNYFFSYLTLQGLFLSANSMVQIGALFTSIALGAWLDNTPRKLW